jgi:hypothetical protein
MKMARIKLPGAFEQWLVDNVFLKQELPTFT